MKKYNDLVLTPEQQEILRRAARLVDGVAREMDVRKEECSHCERDWAVDYAQYRAEQELGAVVTKIGRILGSAEAAERRGNSLNRRG